MISVTSSARDYLTGLIEDQDIDGLGLRLKALNPGLPSADIELTFCPAEDVRDDDHVYEQDELRVYIDPGSMPWVEGASVDFATSQTGGQLTISAPGLKGEAPAEDAPLRERIEWLLNTEINPQVAMHGGHVALVDVTEDNYAVLRFGGGCQGCGMVNVTLQQGIEKTFRERLPDLAGIRDATDHAAGDNPYYS